MCLTQNTSNALHLTLNDKICLIKLLLNKSFNYVLPGSFQSERLEGKFGIYHQAASRCYYILVEKIMNSLALERLKLFSKLDTEEVVSHLKEECCTARKSTLSDIKKASYFIYQDMSRSRKVWLYVRVSLMIQTFLKIQNFCYNCHWGNCRIHSRVI